ncbi:uncharacterized protein [Centruroides vittatus]|uniref:uncharacterized protein n=1 Tax=Centruroides vittatus TaxID=120091 RepID=UPI003510C615
MNQNIVGDSTTYSSANHANKMIVDGNNLLNETEIIKDRGTEKVQRKELYGETAKTNEFMDILPDNYTTETVDFPESPKYRKFAKNSQSSQEQINEKEMDNLSRDFQTENDQNPKQSKLRHIPFSTDGQSFHDSFSSDKEEYFEDDLVTGKLDTAYSISDEDLSIDDDDEHCVNRINSIIEHRSNINDQNNFSNSLEDSFIQDFSISSDNDSEKQFPQNVHKDNKLSNNKLKNGEGFLFDEKASEDVPDTALVNKVKSCFDMEKIKDIYNLSGRLQDILSPAEIEEIVTRSEIYSEFIDDDIIEMLRQEKNNFESLEYIKNQPLENKKKLISVSRHELNMDVIDDIKIRAVFEDQKRSGKDIIDRSKSAKTKDTTPSDLPTPTSGDIRAFFEESLVKSSTTLKKILPNNDQLSADTSLNENSFDLSKQTLLLNVKNLEADTFRNNSKQNSTPILNPDGSIEIKTVKSASSLNQLDKTDIKFANERSNATNSEVSNNQNGNVINEKSRVKGESEMMEKTVKLQGDSSINLNSVGNLRKKKISVNRDILESDEHDDDQKSLSSLSNKSDADVFSPVDDLITPDDIDTPEELNESVFECPGSSLSEPIPEFSAAEELEEERSWKTCIVGGVKRNIDMKVIEPYKKVLSHGGYFGSTRNAIIVFSACYLPDRSRRDYDYVMDNLFLYVLVTLDQLVAEDYVLIYLHGATQRSNMPSFGWLKRCYQMIDRRLRKNLKGLYLVHPTFWLKTIVIMTRPFVSTKFSRKLQFVSTLQELSNLIPMDHICIPDKVKQIEFQCIIKMKKKSIKNSSKLQSTTW